MNKLKKRTILWERTKRPLIFVTVCLAAAFALKYLYEYRTAYNEAKNAPYIIFDSLPDIEKIKNRKAIQTTLLSDKIISNSDKTHFSQKEINRLVSELKSQEFKDADELISKLNTEITNSRNKILKATEMEVEEAEKKSVDLGKKTDKDKNYITEKTSKIKDEEKVNINNLLAELNKYKPQPQASPAVNQTQSIENPHKYLIEALNEFKNKPASEQTKSNLITSVNTFYETKKNEIQKELTNKQTKINSIENNFDIIKNNILDIKKNISTVLFKIENQATNPKLDEQKHQFSYLFLDEKGGLNVLFKLIEVSLTVILVFGLLYIIVIPLRYIFFLSTSADILSEKAKGYLERKNEAVGLRQLGSALLLTAGTVTIGAAVVANSNPVNSMLPSIPQAANIKQIDIPAIANPLNDKYVDINGNTQIVVNRLTDQIKILDQSVTDLSQKINKIEIPENKDLTDELNKISTNLATLNTVVGTEQLLKDPDHKNLPQKIQAMATTISDKNKDQFEDSIRPVKNKIAVESEFNDNKTILGRIGDVENFLKKPPIDNPVIAKLTDISETLGTDEFKKTINPQTPTSDSKLNIWQTMTTIKNEMGDTSDSQIIGGKNTLFGKLNNIFDSISPEGYLNSKSSIFSTLGSNANISNDDTVYMYTRFASKTTKDIGNVGRLLVKDSGNIETFFARLFEGKQYFLNPFLITELEKIILYDEKQIDKNEKQIALNIPADNDSNLVKNNNLQKEITQLRESINNRKLLIEALNMISKDKKINGKKYTAKEICGILITRLIKVPKTSEEYEKKYKEAVNILQENKETILYFSQVDFY